MSAIVVGDFYQTLAAGLLSKHFKCTVKHVRGSTS